MIARRVALLAGAFLIGLAALLPAPAIAPAATAWSLDLVNNSYGDSNYNYDFTAPTINSRGVDWADNLFFYNNASVVRTAGHTGWLIPGSAMYGWQGEAEGTHSLEHWAPSNGVKDALSNCFGLARHIRLYGGAVGYMYNPLFGYYHWATSHWDYNETCQVLGWWSGYSEDAEKSIGYHFGGLGFRVTFDWSGLNNYQEGWEGPNHYWQVNGAATYVNIWG